MVPKVPYGLENDIEDNQPNQLIDRPRESGKQNTTHKKKKKKAHP